MFFSVVTSYISSLFVAQEHFFFFFFCIATMKYECNKNITSNSIEVGPHYLPFSTKMITYKAPSWGYWQTCSVEFTVYFLSCVNKTLTKCIPLYRTT